MLPIDFTVSGSSTVRGWTCTVAGTAQLTTGAATAVRGFDGGVQAATLTVPVNAFQCPEDEMREHLLEAMRADEFPEITFRLESYEASPQGAVATGTLTILDATHPVSFPLSLTPSTTARGPIVLSCARSASGVRIEPDALRQHPS